MYDRGGGAHWLDGEMVASEVALDNARLLGGDGRHVREEESHVDLKEGESREGERKDGERRMRTG